LRRAERASDQAGEAKENFYRSHPAWSLKHLDIPGAFGWNHLDTESGEKVLTRLRHIESMTWRQILVDGKKRNHFIDLD
jgi:hypothetical protein